MHSASWSGFVVSVVLCASLAGCSSGGGTPQSCGSDAECPSGSRCTASACIANAPPVPDVVLPGAPLEANVLHSFDASASADPDAGDSVVSYGWTFRALAADCAPPVVADAGPTANVRFGCPGRYALDLTATDELPASATITREFDVVAYSGPALVTAGADVEVDHACTAVPTRCAAQGEIALSAEAPSLAPEDVTFEWTVEPPATRPLDANRRVTFSPSAFIPSPSVSIETDGQAISGDWIFRVRVRDAAGLVGSAATRVSVKNRPPVIQKTVPIPDHQYSGGVFRASGTIPFSITDPDGDALGPPSVELRHAGDGDGTFTGSVLEGPTRIAFSISVPYGTPADALHLIDGPGLERTVVFSVSDVNDAQTVERWPILVGNRPPALVAGQGPGTVDHGYDAQKDEYFAVAILSSWGDPDGDPLMPVPGFSTLDALCAELQVDPGQAYVASVRCRASFAGSLALPSFAGQHTVWHRIQDPWGAAQAPRQVTFAIANRAPAITSTASHVFGGCRQTSECCRYERETPGVCAVYEVTAENEVKTVPARWSDPDGDPIAVQVTAANGYTPVQPLVCEPGACDLQVNVPGTTRCEGTSPTTDLGVSVTDGLATATGVLPVRRCY